MKKLLSALSLSLLMATGYAQEPLTPEVNRMIEYLMLADEAGLNVPLYIMELSDQLAMLSLTNSMNKEIMEQGAAAAELYAHPLVCMNYAACLMKQQKYGSALHYLNKAWQQDNKNVMLATNMARCHYELGDEANCQAFLNKALSIDPDYGLALQLKATLLLKKKTAESQLEAVDYVLRSALDVWNGISVRQFNSLIAQMQQLYYYYLENKASIPDNFKKLPTPLDGKERYFLQIIRAGRDWADEPPADKFPYPVDPGTLEFEGGEGWAALLDVDNAFAQKANSVKIPFETSEYPTEYTGMTGGDNYQPDSRAFHMTLLAYFYHQIKLLEASYKAEFKELRETEPYEKRFQEAESAYWEAMEEEFERKLQNGVWDPTLIKKYGEMIYLAGKEFYNAVLRIHMANWEKLMRPALEAYAKDIKTGLIYIGNDVGFAYIQSRFDKDIATIYEYGELSYLATLQGDVSLAHGGASIGEQILADLRKHDQDYQDYLTHTRNRRYLEWDSNKKLRAAGLADLNRQREPVPFVSVKVGCYSFQLGIDRRRRVHILFDSPDHSISKVYNVETGASSTTELREVKSWKSYAKDVVTTLGQDASSKGHLSFTPELGERSGERVVTDGRGNVIASSYVKEKSASISGSVSATPPGVGGFVADNFSVGGTFTVKQTSYKNKWYGSSVVPISTRSTVTFDAGVGVNGFNIFSASFGAAQGSL